MEGGRDPFHHYLRYYHQLPARVTGEAYRAGSDVWGWRVVRVGVRVRVVRVGVRESCEGGNGWVHYTHWLNSCMGESWQWKTCMGESDMGSIMQTALNLQLYFHYTNIKKKKMLKEPRVKPKAYPRVTATAVLPFSIRIYYRLLQQGLILTVIYGNNWEYL